MINSSIPSKSRSGSVQRAKKFPKIDPKLLCIEIDLSSDGKELSMGFLDADTPVSQMDLTELLKAMTKLILAGYKEDKNLVSLLAMLQAASNIDVTADDRAYIGGVIKLFEGINPTIHLWCRDDNGYLMVLPTNRYAFC